MKAKKLDINEAIWWGLSPDSGRNGVGIGTINIVASATRIKRLLFVPRSTRSDQGAHKIGRMADGACEPNFDPKIFSLSEIS